jgi:hypothetical protein
MELMGEQFCRKAWYFLGKSFALDSRSSLINYDLFWTLFKNRSVRNTPEDGSA